MALATRLKKEARESAEFRGHTLTRFRRAPYPRKRGQQFRAYCRTCEAWVFVDTAPAPNGISIYGRAVALNCPAGKPTGEG